MAFFSALFSFFLISFAVYFILSLAVSIYASIFWYREWSETAFFKTKNSLKTGFCDLWLWALDLSIHFLNVFTIRYLRAWGSSDEEIAELYDKDIYTIKSMENESCGIYFYLFFVRK